MILGIEYMRMVSELALTHHPIYSSPTENYIEGKFKFLS